MKKLVVQLLGVFISMLTLALLAVNVAAQENKSPYEVSYQAYLDQMGSYNKAHQEYVLRKSQYESFGTLQAQQDAQSATVKMLQERDGAVLAYLTALRERVNENPGITDILKSALFAQIDTEITWFTDHKANIPTAGTLNDLEKDSKDASEEFAAAQTVFYKSLGSISDGRFLDLSSRFNDRFTELKEKLSEIKAEERSEYMFDSDKLQRLDRWVFDAEARIERAEAKEAEAQKLIFAIGSGSRTVKNLPDTYAQILKSLSEAQQYMKEAGGFLQEIIRDIKTAEE